MEKRYLQLLAREYPNRQAALCEIANLTAMSSLPKGTEYFFSDLHGEHKGFSELMNGASGVIREKIRIQFQDVLTNPQQNQLANLIYDPVKVLSLMHEYGRDTNEWMKNTIFYLTQLCRSVSAKYSRVHVRSKIPHEYDYLMEELLYPGQDEGRLEYGSSIIEAVVSSGLADTFIPQFCKLIRSLTMDWIHVIGDIFDRGPRPDRIMEELIEYGDVDIQWGNHDISWMGAACGNLALVANVVRIAVSYNNFDVLEDGYGINLVPLASFAIETYANDPCQCFRVHAQEDSDLREVSLNMKMHKAIAIIQFKLEGQVIKRRPEFNMDKRLLLDKIDYEEGTIMIEGKKYELLDKSFPTIDPNNPYELSEAEEALMNRLCMNFLNCDKLQEHIRFLFNKGGLYLCYNSNLLYHGCVPLDEKGNFRKVKIGSKQYSGKELYDVLEYYARKGYYEQDNREEHEYGKDIMWYIWSNENSPVYGKEKMATFERYFIADKEVQIERKDHYYRLIEREDVVNNILKEFGVDIEKGHIINGHMPVHVKEGESPVKCNGKVMIIDGGFSKAYRGTTGIAGYTLIYNSRGLRLVSHETFTSTEDVIEKEIDVHSDTVIREVSAQRERVIDTETGRQLKEQISDLEKLLHAYRTGQILEKE